MQTEEARKFAGLTVGTRWRVDDGREVMVRKAVDAKDHGIRYTRLVFDTGEQAADDFLTYVRVGKYEPLGGEADDAYVFAHQSDSGGKLDE
jgi:hypothetical protein